MALLEVQALVVVQLAMTLHEQVALAIQVLIHPLRDMQVVMQ